MYSLIEQARESYALLQDDLSKKVFKARLTFDLEPTMTNAMNLLLLNHEFNCQEVKEILEWKQTLKQIESDGKKFIIYGAGGLGKQAAITLINENIDFYGFCSRKGAQGYPEGKVMGKPVISSKQLIEHKEDYYVAICAASFDEIMATLEAGGFPQEHILHCFDCSRNNNQYFEFPELYRDRTAFIDGGCLNCQDDYRFASWCNYAYSYILAFEPDPNNFRKCIDNLDKRPIRDIKIVEAGLAEKNGNLLFSACANGGSYIQGNTSASIYQQNRNEITVKICALDDMVDEREVGFIKLDIEGAELDALHRAERTIMRDKPFLALSVYHRNGDVLALMTFLHEIVPQYKFWLRHYGPLHYETVLYVSTDK